MKLLISPAKSLDFEKDLPLEKTTTPIFEKEAFYINSILKEQSRKELGKLMRISDTLASMNWDRNQKFKSPSTSSRAAVFAFNGDVYSGLDAYTLPQKNINTLEDKLRILSGLYGLLKPLDAIRPYRLEMGTSLILDTHKNLYSFWKSKITNQLNAELKKGELLVNLASKEYFSAIDSKLIQSPIVTPHFKDFKSGKFKIISFFAKKARGMMVRYLIDIDASSINEILGFNFDGYTFSESETQDELNPVFVR